MTQLKTSIISIVIIVSLTNSQGYGQNTVGLTFNEDRFEEAYTLFAPLQSTSTYLIDNCGYKIMEWTSEVNPGAAAYLYNDGNLIRTGVLTNDRFLISGKGGLIEIKNWNDELVWSFTLSDSSFCLHHDLEIMPNGNILAIVSEYKTEAEVLEAGRPTADGVVYNEKIIEIKPNLDTGEAAIVWEWSAWDHLIQDVDILLPNFGEVSSSPGRIDINYYNTAQLQRDWLHVNSIDYNEALDQLVLTSRRLEELWVIDHSTTTVEAASSQGGIYGQGGDILYRWGNPATYRQGQSADKQLGKPHDAQWVADASTSGDRIMIFNNEYQSGLLSAVHILDIPITSEGKYNLLDTIYGPLDYEYTYSDEVFYSSFASGASILEDNHLLICDADNGRFFEVNTQNEIVWEYINPVTRLGIADQGTDVSSITNNAVFKIERYAADFEGFIGRDLIPQGPVESMSDYDCSILSYVAVDNIGQVDVEVYPNPVTDVLHISTSSDIKSYTIYNMQGQKIANKSSINTSQAMIPMHQYPQGMYVIQVSLGRDEVQRQLIFKD